MDNAQVMMDTSRIFRLKHIEVCRRTSCGHLAKPRETRVHKGKGGRLPPGRLTCPVKHLDIGGRAHPARARCAHVVSGNSLGGDRPPSEPDLLVSCADLVLRSFGGRVQRVPDAMKAARSSPVSCVKRGGQCTSPLTTNQLERYICFFSLVKPYIRSSVSHPGVGSAAKVACSV
jgi:hypothetical protein